MKIIRPLLQEIYQNDPWKMLCCCIMLNLCRRTTIDTVRHELFKLTIEEMNHERE